MSRYLKNEKSFLKESSFRTMSKGIVLFKKKAVFILRVRSVLYEQKFESFT